VGKEVYMRKKSRLTGKRVKKDKAFQRTMENAGILAKASRIGSVTYKGLPEDFRQFWMYKAFTGEAIRLLREGMPTGDVQQLLKKVYVDVKYRKSRSANALRKKIVIHHLISPVAKTG